MKKASRRGVSLSRWNLHLHIYVLRRQGLFRTPEAVGDQLQDVVIVSESSGGRGHAEVTVLRQHNVLRTHAHLEVLVVVGHPVVEEKGQGVLVVLYFSPENYEG